MVTLWWEGSFEFGERVIVTAEELDPYLADFVSANRGRQLWRTHVHAAGRRPAPRRVARLSRRLTAGQDRDLVAVVHGRLQAVEEPDVLAAHVDVHEPAQVAVLSDPVAQAVVAVVQPVQHLADGAGLVDLVSASPPVNPLRSCVGSSP